MGVVCILITSGAIVLDKYYCRLYGKNIYICRTLYVKRTSCYKPTNELQDACSQAVDKMCSQAVDKMCSHCLFSGVERSLEQAVNDL